MKITYIYIDDFFVMKSEINEFRHSNVYTQIEIFNLG